MPVPDTTQVVHLREIGVEGQRPRYLPQPTRTSLRTLTSLRETPQAVTVIGRELIDDQAMQGLGDVLQYVPGARMGQGEGNRDQPTLRGNASTSGFFVDGMRDDVQYVRDLYNVDRVEVLLGANALLFGRGGTGGIINRVSKSAGQRSVREATVAAGSQGSRRGTLDIGTALGARAAVRANAMIEDSDLFRRGTNLERYGFNPVATLTPTSATTMTFGVEHFHDARTADRGVPSFGGRPVAVDPATFFGNADLSRANVRVNAADATVAHRLSPGMTVRTQLHAATYDKFYQNVYPGAVTAAGDAVRIVAYNDATDRTNLLGQADLLATVRTGALHHDLVFGVTAGRQATDNFRMTGYFNGAATAVEVPLGDPVTNAPVTFRQSPSDADNRALVHTASAHLQDQVAVGNRWRFIAGIGVERFAVQVHDNRKNVAVERADLLVSPRAGVVFRAADNLALYGSYSESALPSSGDQFSSLDATTSTLRPERFRNVEAGAKWDAGDRVALTLAAYQLDRSHSRAFDPADPTRTIQTGSQRSRGVEIGVQGAVTEWWQVAGGYARQDAVVTSATTAASAGARVPLVPRHSAALWNRVRLGGGASVGLGVTRQGESFTGLDNTVVLPAYTRLDAAAYLRVGAGLDLQANIENVLGARYFLTSHNNNNITPGAPRSVRVTATTRF
ncbi:MAG: TonB-dependent siderophore receptor [Gemmatimonadales bacterium]|nr:TonB-dependent siderophore receptor [Gemmatimonadales bacterium]